MSFSESEKIILEFFVEREGQGIIDDIGSLDFIDEGILDSLDFVIFATFIEERFGKKLDLTDEKTFSAMRNFGDLVQLVTDA